MEVFLSNVWIATRQVLILYVMVAVGFLCDKTGLFTEKTARLTNNLLFYVITTAVIVKSFATTPFTPETAKQLLLASLCAVGTHVLGILLTLPLYRKGRPHDVIYKYACIYGNFGYMALPLAQALLGNEGVLYCSMGVLVFQVFCFTHGIHLMDKKEEKTKFSIKKILLNPGVIGILLGLPFFVTGLKMPDFLLEPVSGIASMNTPLAMILLGTYMSNCGMKGLLSDKNNYFVTLIKNIVVPLIMLVILKTTGIVTGTLLVSTLIQASAPVANNTVMFSAQYGHDTGVATKTVTFSTFASVLTMPCIIALARL
ncbi:MAG: AEC family transporter [Clostridia bacterium]|nr:AEC family transporter [Clostridia bacterium]